MDEVSLKEYFEKLLEERDKHYDTLIQEKDRAVNTALIASDKRLDLLNELRSGIATKDEIRALEKVVDDLKTSRDAGVGKHIGIQQFIGWIIAAIAIIGFIIAVWNNK